MNNKPTPPAFTVQSVERALYVLETLSRSADELGVSELAAATGLANGTVHRLLATLTYLGYIRQNPYTRKYSLGLKSLSLATAALERIGPAARPFLEELMQVSQETTNLAILERNSTMYIEQVPAPRMVRMFIEPGNRAPLHSTASGKVLLAHQSPHVIRSIIRQTSLPRMTSNTTTDLQQLSAELDRVRKQGYATDFEETEEGIRALAVPIFSLNGQILAAMSLAGPANRLGRPRIEELIPHTKRIAAKLSQSLEPLA